MSYTTTPAKSIRVIDPIGRAWRFYPVLRTSATDATGFIIRCQRVIYGRRHSDRALAPGETRFIPTLAQRLVA